MARIGYAISIGREWVVVSIVWKYFRCYRKTGSKYSATFYEQLEDAVRDMRCIQRVHPGWKCMWVQRIVA